MAQKLFYVEIVEMERDGQPEKVIKRMGPMSERMAEKVENGANINLNHEHSFTRQVEEKQESANNAAD